MNENKKAKAHVLISPIDDEVERYLLIDNVYGVSLGDNCDLEGISEDFEISKENLNRLFDSIVVEVEDTNNKKDNENVFDGSEIFDEYYKELVFENVKYDSRINYEEISKKLAEEKEPDCEYIAFSIEEVRFSFGGKHNLKILVKKNQGV